MIEDMLQRRPGLHDVVYRAEQCGVRGAVDGCLAARGGDQADVVPAPQARLTLRAEGQPFLKRASRRRQDRIEHPGEHGRRD
jgi:hypothetical protein